MAMQKISVTRGLAMLKTLSSKIENAIACPFVGVAVGKDAQRKPLGKSGTVAEHEALYQGAYDTVTALIKQRQAIKTAIVASNASTKITLGGVEMTVAGAIELKSSVEFKRTLMQRMQMQLLQAENLATNQNAALQTSIDKLLETAAGGDKAKMDSEGSRQIAKLQQDMKEASLIDPIKIATKIEALKKDIENVDLELDFTLSESNAKTEIEVDLAA